MISNERSWPHQRQNPRQPYYQRPGYQQSGYQQPGYPRPDGQPMRPVVREDTLATRELQIERKHYLLMLKENVRGRFIRISEESGGRNNSIIIPAAGIEDFKKVFEELISAAAEAPDTTPPQAQSPE